MEFGNTFFDFGIVGVESAVPNSNGESSVICPVCEPTREHKGQKKLGVNKAKGVWRCNHCGWTGGLTPIDWIKNKPIVERNGLLDLTEAQIKYFAKRGISHSTLLAREVKSKTTSIRQRHAKEEEPEFETKSCIAFVSRENGWVMMIKYRDGKKNFKIEKGSKLVPWGIDWIKNQEEYAIITEGEPDTLSYHEVGLIHTCSVPNGTTITVEEKEYYMKTGKIDSASHLSLSYFDITYQYFEKKKVIYIATDNDAAGIKLRNEIGRRFGYDKCKIINFAEYIYKDDTGAEIACKDANDVLVHLGPERLKDTLTHAENFPLNDVVTIDNVIDKIHEQWEFGLKKGKPTGFKDLDPHFSWKLGHLIGFNGYGNMGKSSFLFNLLILGSILYDYKWGCYLPENYPVEDAYIIFIEIFIGNTIDKDKPNRASKQDIENARKFIKDHFEFVDCEKGYTPEELRAVAKRMIMQRGIIGFVTDPWNALTHSYTGTLDQYLENELSAEQRFTTTYNIIKIIVVHPPTPQGDDRKDPPVPSIYQITGGGVWSKKLYEALAVHQQHEKGSEALSEVHVQKVKTPKLVGIKTNPKFPVLLHFHRRDHRFYNYDNTDPFEIAKKAQQAKIYEGQDLTLF